MTAATMTALDRLYADAEARGWTPEQGRNARPDCWHDEAGTSEFTIKPPATDVGIAVLSAHTPTDSLRLHIGGADPEKGIVRILRIFLGWPEGGES